MAKAAFRFQGVCFYEWPTRAGNAAHLYGL
jgi:hypothetical protein